MESLERLFPKLPLGETVVSFVDLLKENLSGLFKIITNSIEFLTKGFIQLMELPPPLIMIIIIGLLAWWIAGWKMGIFTLIGLGLINNLEYWPETIETLSLVLISVIIAMIIGVPVGIWMSQNRTVQSVVTPILDFMQTMPAFVYLIPSVVFFGIGMTPGIIATIIFSMPPTVRLTNLGIRQVDAELIEASNAFGSTVGQRLGKIQLPLAMPQIMAGVNQTIMLSLSMVVIASLVGAPGLGEDVTVLLSKVKLGMGFEAGISLVILAMILDRVTQGASSK